MCMHIGFANQLIYIIDGLIECILLEFIISCIFIYQLLFWFMGCGSINGQEITSSLRKTLFYRVKRRVDYIKNTTPTIQTLPFFSIEELELVSKSLLNFRQTEDIQSLKTVGGDNHYLLSAQRRALWKLSLLNFDGNWKIQDNTFTTTPTTNNQKTKQRFYQISLDINRTFTGINFNRNELSIILQNISLYFQGVGYTQGMNFIVGFLLLCGFTAKQSYDMFIRLSYSKYFFLVRNFTQKFQNVNTCIFVMQNIMDRQENTSLKEIKTHFQSVGMNVFIFVFSWFLTYFIYICNIRSCVLIWDYIILHDHQTSENQQEKLQFGRFGCGLICLTNLTLKILVSLSEQILLCENSESLMNLLRNEPMQAYLSEQKIEELIRSCKLQPLVSVQIFNGIIAEKDPELLSLIGANQKRRIQGENSSQNRFQTFIQNCRHSKQGNISISKTNGK